MFRSFVHHDHVFVPTIDGLAPGRKGRMAITLADGTEVVVGDAEVLSSSAVPQGPHQRPGIRLRFATLDPAARETMAKLERSRTSPGVPLESKGVGTDRASLLAVGDRARDLSEAVMCRVVEPGAPDQVMPAMDRYDRTPTAAPPAPRPMPIPAPKPGGLSPASGFVPGKSFKIPSIPTPPSGTVTTHVGPPPTGPKPATPKPVTSEPASGDVTVPSPAPASISGPTAAGGKQRNRTQVAKAAVPPPDAVVQAVTGSDVSAGWGSEAVTRPIADAMAITAPTAETARMAEPPRMPVVDIKPTERMEPLEIHAAGAVPPPPPPAVAPKLPDAVAVPPPSPIAALEAAAASPPPPPKAFARTLLGMPAITVPKPGSDAPAEIGWAVPEDGVEGEPTERSDEPIASVSDTEQFAAVEPPPDDAPSWQVPAATAPQPWQPGAFKLPATPPGASVAALRPAAIAQPPPNVPAPPLPPMPPPAPLPPAPVMQPHAFAPPAPARTDDAVPHHRAAEPTELVYGDREDTDIVALKRRQRRPLIIGAVAFGLIAMVVIIVLATGGNRDDKPTKQPAVAAGSAVVAVDAGAAPAAPDAAVAAPVAAIDAAAAVAQVEVDAAAVVPEPEPEQPEPEPEPAPIADKPPPVVKTPGECAVAVASTPKGADVIVARKKRGRTPITIQLPCGKKAKVELTRSHYDDESKTVTPKEGSTTKLNVRMERPKFSLKITSNPPGSTVTINGKNVGKTPVTTKVQGFEPISIKVSKPGFQAKSTKTELKKTGTALSFTLKRGN